MQLNTGEALVVLLGAAAFAILVMIALRTGKTWGKGTQYSRAESPLGFWITITAQSCATLLLVISL